MYRETNEFHPFDSKATNEFHPFDIINYIQITVKYIKMITITKRISRNYIKIPYPSKKEWETIEFTLKNTSTREMYNYVFEDEGKYEEFYSCKFTTPDIPNGEYEYQLGDATGILKVED